MTIEAKIDALPNEARNYHEDYADENGNYIHECPKCGQRFRGHKRRWDCKACHLKGLEEMAVQISTDTHPALLAAKRDAERQSAAKWIPVSERLPENEGGYLVQTQTGPYTVFEIAEFSDGDVGWTFYFVNNDQAIEDDFTKVVAWVPLPDPYTALDAFAAAVEEEKN